MKNIIMYTGPMCNFCDAAKRLFSRNNLKYKEIDIETSNISREDLSKLTGGGTVPQIVINEKCIGGFDSLMQLEQSGELDQLIQK